MCAFSFKCKFSIHENILYLLFPPLPEQFSLEALCGGLDSTQNSVGAGWKLGTLLGVGRGSKSEQSKKASRKRGGAQDGVSQLSNRVKRYLRQSEEEKRPNLSHGSEALTLWAVARLNIMVRSK